MASKVSEKCNLQKKHNLRYSRKAKISFVQPGSPKQLSKICFKKVNRLNESENIFDSSNPTLVETPVKTYSTCTNIDYIPELSYNSYKPNYFNEKLLNLSSINSFNSNLIEKSLRIPYHNTSLCNKSDINQNTNLSYERQNICLDEIPQFDVANRSSDQNNERAVQWNTIRYLRSKNQYDIPLSDIQIKERLYKTLENGQIFKSSRSRKTSKQKAESNVLIKGLSNNMSEDHSKDLNQKRWKSFGLGEDRLRMMNRTVGMDTNCISKLDLIKISTRNSGTTSRKEQTPRNISSPKCNTSTSTKSIFSEYTGLKRIALLANQNSNFDESLDDEKKSVYNSSKNNNHKYYQTKGLTLIGKEANEYLSFCNYADIDMSKKLLRRTTPAALNLEEGSNKRNLFNLSSCTIMNNMNASVPSNILSKKLPSKKQKKAEVIKRYLSRENNIDKYEYSKSQTCQNCFGFIPYEENIRDNPSINNSARSNTTLIDREESGSNMEENNISTLSISNDLENKCISSSPNYLYSSSCDRNANTRLNMIGTNIRNTNKIIKLDETNNLVEGILGTKKHSKFNSDEKNKRISSNFIVKKNHHDHNISSNDETNFLKLTNFNEQMNISHITGENSNIKSSMRYKINSLDHLGTNNVDSHQQNLVKSNRTKTNNHQSLSHLNKENKIDSFNLSTVKSHKLDNFENENNAYHKKKIRNSVAERTRNYIAQSNIINNKNDNRKRGSTKKSNQSVIRNSVAERTRNYIAQSNIINNKDDNRKRGSTKKSNQSVIRNSVAERNSQVLVCNNIEYNENNHKNSTLNSLICNGYICEQTIEENKIHSLKASKQYKETENPDTFDIDKFPDSTEEKIPSIELKSDQEFQFRITCNDDYSRITNLIGILPSEDIMNLGNHKNSKMYNIHQSSIEKLSDSSKTKKFANIYTSDTNHNLDSKEQGDILETSLSQRNLKHLTKNLKKNTDEKLKPIKNVISEALTNSTLNMTKVDIPDNEFSASKHKCKQINYSSLSSFKEKQDFNTSIPQNKYQSNLEHRNNKILKESFNYTYPQLNNINQSKTDIHSNSYSCEHLCSIHPEQYKKNIGDSSLHTSSLIPLSSFDIAKNEPFLSNQTIDNHNIIDQNSDSNHGLNSSHINNLKGHDIIDNSYLMKDKRIKNLYEQDKAIKEFNSVIQYNDINRGFPETLETLKLPLKLDITRNEMSSTNFVNHILISKNNYTSSSRSLKNIGETNLENVTSHKLNKTFNGFNSIELVQNNVPYSMTGISKLAIFCGCAEDDTENVSEIFESNEDPFIWENSNDSLSYVHPKELNNNHKEITLRTHNILDNNCCNIQKEICPQSTIKRLKDSFLVKHNIDDKESFANKPEQIESLSSEINISPDAILQTSFDDDKECTKEKRSKIPLVNEFQDEQIELEIQKFIVPLKDIIYESEQDKHESLVDSTEKFTNRKDFSVPGKNHILYFDHNIRKNALEPGKTIVKPRQKNIKKKNGLVENNTSSKLNKEITTKTITSDIKKNLLETSNNLGENTQKISDKLLKDNIYIKTQDKADIRKYYSVELQKNNRKLTRSSINSKESMIDSPASLSLKSCSEKTTSENNLKYITTVSINEDGRSISKEEKKCIRPSLSAIGSKVKRKTRISSVPLVENLSNSQSKKEAGVWEKICYTDSLVSPLSLSHIENNIKSKVQRDNIEKKSSLDRNINSKSLIFNKLSDCKIEKSLTLHKYNTIRDPVSPNSDRFSNKRVAAVEMYDELNEMCSGLNPYFRISRISGNLTQHPTDVLEVNI